MYQKKRTYENAVPGDAPGGPGSPAVADSQPPRDVTPPAVATQTLAQQANTNSNANAVTAGPDDWLPEKFRTAKVDGSGLDVDASARKLAQSYAELEKRGGPAREGVPPSAAEYKLNLEKVPEGIDPTKIGTDPLFKSFLENAHKNGLSNDQVNAVMADYFDVMPQVLGARLEQDATAARTSLTKAWGADQFDANLNSAVRAARGFGGGDGELGNIDTLMSKFGSDPDFLAFAAKVGAEMAEDVPIQGDPVSTGAWQDQVNSIRMSDAYKDAGHLEHAKAVTQMNDLYAKRYGTKKAFRGNNI